MSNSNRMGRRINRHRKMPEINKNQESKTAQEISLINSTNTDPGLSKTCHAIGWNQRKNSQLPPINEMIEDIDHHQENIRHSSFSGGSITESVMLRSSNAFS